MWKKIPAADKAILIGFGSLSLINVIYWLALPHKSFNIPSLINSALCFLAIFLFIKNKMASYYLFVIWSIVQFPFITRIVGFSEDPILNLTQGFRLALIGYSSGDGYHVRANILPFFFLGFSYRLYLTLIKGYKFTLIPLKKDNIKNNKRKKKKNDKKKKKKKKKMIED